MNKSDVGLIGFLITGIIIFAAGRGTAKMNLIGEPVGAQSKQSQPAPTTNASVDVNGKLVAENLLQPSNEALQRYSGALGEGEPKPIALHDLQTLDKNLRIVSALKAADVSVGSEGFLEFLELLQGHLYVNPNTSFSNQRDEYNDTKVKRVPGGWLLDAACNPYIAEFGAHPDENYMPIVGTYTSALGCGK